MLKYYNDTTKTLTIYYDFIEELKDLSNETKIIIFSEYVNKFKYSKFNQVYQIQYTFIC
jgi:hypothetical protein